jgi:hypothetical protein
MTSTVFNSHRMMILHSYRLNTGSRTEHSLGQCAGNGIPTEYNNALALSFVVVCRHRQNNNDIAPLEPASW